MVMADSDNDSGGGSGGGFCSPREQDRLLPIANVSRIMKRALPANAKVSKDAKETVQECVSEFISFVTGEASDKCQREKRKTINGDDLLWAMSTLGFDGYLDPLKGYLQRFREAEGEKAGASATTSSSSYQPQQGDGGGGGMMMVGQPAYGAVSPSPASSAYHHEMGMGMGTGGSGSNYVVGEGHAGFGGQGRG